MKRIAVIGTTGSGKSTLARLIAKRLALAYIELDAINWQENWTEMPRAEMADRVGKLVQGDGWVVEGGYSFVRDTIWQRADTVIWLDYPFWTVFGRLFRRTMRRAVKQEVLWAGNRESLVRAFSRDSILLWCIKTHRRRHRQYGELVMRPEYAHLKVLRFRHPYEAEEFIRSLHEHQTSSELGHGCHS